MGLDFDGYWLKKNETPSDYWALPYTEQEERELFYGRKSWELVHFLRCPTDGNCEGELTLERWVALMEALGQLGDTFEDIWDAYYLWEERMDAYDYNFMNFWKVHPKEAKLIETYEIWHKKTFNEEPWLGYYFSVGYMLTFWKACDEVLKYLEDPEYKVWMSASY